MLAVALRRQGKARHLGTEPVQPQAQPRTLEAGVAGDEDAFAAEYAEHIRRQIDMMRRAVKVSGLRVE